MRTCLIGRSAIFLVALSLSCCSYDGADNGPDRASNHSAATSIPSQAKPSPEATLAIAQKTPDAHVNSIAVLCEQLERIQLIPYENDQPSGDPVYDGLLAAGKEALPCLVKEISNRKIITDPREGDPHIHGFTVGDAAVFVLSDITKVPIKEMLPSEIADKKWGREGIFLYFKYVEKQENRRHIQQWWMRRLRETNATQ